MAPCAIYAMGVRFDEAREPKNNRARLGSNPIIPTEKEPEDGAEVKNTPEVSDLVFSFS